MNLRLIPSGGIVVIACAASACTFAFVVEPETKSNPESASAAAEESKSQGELAFEKMKTTLPGVWEGEFDDEGSMVRETFTIIAGGATLMHTTSFPDNPASTMVTMYHMSGDDLVLKHYCVAGNQPEMKATKFGDDLATIAFTYMGGMADRNQGHMDEAVFTFIDDKSFKDKWSWYEDGAFTWGHELTYTRVEEK